MPKLVDMLKVFKREKKGPRGMDKEQPRSRKGNRSVLDADSFIFMPGGTESQYWGDVLNDDNFPRSQQLAEDKNLRRKTHIGFVQSDESNGVQEVNLIISPSVQEKDGDLVMNGKVFNRRLSGTLVKANMATDEVEDGPVIRDYAFLLSARERLSQELSSRYVYDRLVRPPLRSQKSSSPSETSAHQWQYPERGSGGKKSPPFAESRRRMNSDDEVIVRVTAPDSSSPTARDDRFLRVERGQTTCPVRDLQNCRLREHKCLRVQRPLSGQTLDSQGYSNLEMTRSAGGSEYAMPADALHWERTGKDLKSDVRRHGMLGARAPHVWVVLCSAV